MRLLLIADTHVPKRARHLPAQIWDEVSQADVVNVKIIEVDAERRRLSLSLKRVDDGEDVQPRADGQPLETPAPPTPIASRRSRASSWRRC